MKLFYILGLNEITDIISTLGESHRTIYHMCGTIRLDNKVIFYENERNELRIQSSDGEKTTIRISFSSKEGEDYLGRKKTFLSHECFIDYYLRDGSVIKLYNELSLPKGYDGFESVQTQDLMSGLKIRYYDKDKNESAFSISAESVLIDDIKLFIFEEDGVHYTYKTFSPDGNKLMKISGTTAPSLEEVESFDLEKEEERIKKFAEMDSDIHPFSKEALDVAVRALLLKQKTANIVKESYKEDLEDVKRAIKVREDFLSAIKTGILTSEELDAVAKQFRREVKGKCYHK